MSGVERRELRSAIAYPGLLALGALDAAAYSVIAPVLPEVARATGAGPAVAGLLVASFPVGVLAGFPVAGRAVERRGPSPVLVGSLLLLASGSAGFASGEGLAAYFLARLVMGLGSGGLWLGIAFGTLERWPGKEYLCMSRIFASYSVGGLIGPALGALGGIRGPFLLYSALAAAAIPVVLLMDPPAERRRFTRDRRALRLPRFRLASTGVLFAVLALGVAEGVLPLHLGTRLEQAEIGVLLVGMSLLVAGAAAGAARFRPLPALLGSAVPVVLGLGLAGVGRSAAWWAPALAVAGLGIGAANTGAVGVLLEAVPAERMVTAMVAWSQVGMAGYLAGPLAGGWVGQELGFRFIGLVPASAALLLAAAARRATPRPPP